MDCDLNIASSGKICVILFEKKKLAVYWVVTFFLLL